MTHEDISAMVHDLGDMVKNLAQAEPADKMRIYDRLKLRLEYDPGARVVTVDVKTAGLGLEPNTGGVYKAGVRGPTQTLRTYQEAPFGGSFSLDSPFPERIAYMQ